MLTFVTRKIDVFPPAGNIVQDGLLVVECGSATATRAIHVEFLLCKVEVALLFEMKWR